ncbi:MAG: acetylglucosamine-6-sulfatase [Planctomycetes bacterium]|nr:acetylglucosamine-6-sulfatase [Planctomycetota bacterium]
MTRLPRALLVLLALSSWGFARIGPAQEVTSPPPNIVFFLTDDQRDDTLGCAGHPILQTPTIDGLAARGVRFSNMFVSHSICWVSRASLLTGQTARSSGRADRLDFVRADAARALYPQLLREAGYRTGHFGKFHARMPQGWDRATAFDVYLGMHRDPYFKKQPDGSLRHETELIADHAIEFLKEQPADQPFAIQLWFNAAHAEDGDHRPGIGHFPWPQAVDGMYEDIEMPAPRLGDPAIFAAMPDYLKQSILRERWHWRWDTPEKYQTNLRAYFRMISGIDGAMARVLQALEERGFADNTIVVYSADNGYFMGDRGFAGKWAHFDESLRVPLIIFDPRAAAESTRGSVVKAFALNLDLPASFLAWAGVDIPDSYQGRDLSPWLHGPPPDAWREDMFFEHVFLRPTISWEGVRGERWKYARYFDQAVQDEWLHDLQTDPDELVNLASDPAYAEVLQAMRQRTAAYVAQYGAPVQGALPDYTGN